MFSFSHLTHVCIYHAWCATHSWVQSDNTLGAHVFRLLFRNKLSGTLPRELEQLTSLRSMYGGLVEYVPLCCAHVRDVPSACFLNVCVVAVVRLTPHSRVRISWPQSDNTLRAHVFRNLHGNRLIGALPRELGQLTSLTNMYGGLVRAKYLVYICLNV
jgi:hypothetical protein